MSEVDTITVKRDGFTDDLLNMGYTKGIKDGYNKAIDDVIKTVNSILPFDTCAGRFIDRDLLHKKLIDLRN